MSDEVKIMCIVADKTMEQTKLKPTINMEPVQEPQYTQNQNMEPVQGLQYMQNQYMEPVQEPQYMQNKNRNMGPVQEPQYMQNQNPNMGPVQEPPYMQNQNPNMGPVQELQYMQNQNSNMGPIQQSIPNPNMKYESDTIISILAKGAEMSGEICSANKKLMYKDVCISQLMREKEQLKRNNIAQMIVDDTFGIRIQKKVGNPGDIIGFWKIESCTPHVIIRSKKISTMYFDVKLIKFIAGNIQQISFIVTQEELEENRILDLLSKKAKIIMMLPNMSLKVLNELIKNYLMSKIELHDVIEYERTGWYTTDKGHKIYKFVKEGEYPTSLNSSKAEVSKSYDECLVIKKYWSLYNGVESIRGRVFLLLFFHCSLIYSEFFSKVADDERILKVAINQPIAEAMISYMMGNIYESVEINVCDSELMQTFWRDKDMPSVFSTSDSKSRSDKTRKNMSKVYEEVIYGYSFDEHDKKVVKRGLVIVIDKFCSMSMKRDRSLNIDFFVTGSIEEWMKILDTKSIPGNYIKVFTDWISQNFNIIKSMVNTERLKNDTFVHIFIIMQKMIKEFHRTYGVDLPEWFEKESLEDIIMDVYDEFEEEVDDDEMVNELSEMLFEQLRFDKLKLNIQNGKGKAFEVDLFEETKNSLFLDKKKEVFFVNSEVISDFVLNQASFRVSVDEFKRILKDKGFLVSAITERYVSRMSLKVRGQENSEQPRMIKLKSSLLGNIELL
ncbi:hypothetical protein [[Clostridium] fimetarium]|uniref:Uncharacterized protein n=1 Tax=[Clostridium] fimetarium TaxID=99656 RepID=A0A1I0Q134_9FIRM|nr:hypothetical protein [[Clostridium] fimetarium]SEW20584.1 hypothetical protein SAMN05421659_106208 [[Clostridium] fimetarium]